MSFAAQMRLGSLEILTAFAFFALLAARWKAAEARKSAAWRLALQVQEALTAHPAPVSAVLSISNQQGRIIGRAEEADLVLRDPEVSRRHARLDLVSGVVYVSDLGSSNGTFLNGKPVADEGIELRPGDYIDVGNTRISVLGMEPAS